MVVGGKDAHLIVSSSHCCSCLLQPSFPSQERACRERRERAKSATLLSDDEIGLGDLCGKDPGSRPQVCHSSNNSTLEFPLKLRLARPVTPAHLS